MVACYFLNIYSIILLKNIYSNYSRLLNSVVDNIHYSKTVSDVDFVEKNTVITRQVDNTGSLIITERLCNVQPDTNSNRCISANEEAHDDTRSQTTLKKPTRIFSRRILVALMYRMVKSLDIFSPIEKYIRSQNCFHIHSLFSLTLWP